MTWVSTVDMNEDQHRIDIQRAVVAIVHEAGHPLTTKEIKERLTSYRGINEFFQIHPTDTLIRLGPGLWGIDDRDIPDPR